MKNEMITRELEQIEKVLELLEKDFILDVKIFDKIEKISNNSEVILEYNYFTFLNNNFKVIAELKEYEEKEKVFYKVLKIETFVKLINIKTYKKSFEKLM